MVQKQSITPDYENFLLWENYSEELLLEYRQSVEEGLELSSYQELFEAVKADYALTLDAVNQI